MPAPTNVTVRWLNGSEDILGPCFKIRDVMVKAAALKKCLAPEISVLQENDSRDELVPIDYPDDEPCPVHTVVWNPAPKRAVLWQKAIELHTESHDVDGLKRALEIQKSYVGNREAFAKACRRRAMQRYLMRDKESEMDFATRSQIVEILAFGPTMRRAKATGLAIFAVRYCAAYGHADILALLLDKYADDFDIDECERNEPTPLGYAAQHGDLEVCKMLIEHGADVCMYTADENSGMCWGPIPHGRTAEVRQLLFDHGATIGSIFGDLVPFDLTIEHGTKLARIAMRSSNYVVDVQFQVRNADGRVRGVIPEGSTPGEKQLTLEDDEEIVEISGHCGELIDCLCFTTNKGRKVEAGTRAGGVAFSYKGARLTRMHGGIGGFLLNFRAEFEPNTVFESDYDRNAVEWASGGTYLQSREDDDDDSYFESDDDL